MRGASSYKATFNKQVASLVVVACSSQGKTLASHLEALKEKYGYFVGKNSYVKFFEDSVLEDIFEEVRNGNEYVSDIGGVKVASVRDLTRGYDR